MNETIKALYRSMIQQTKGGQGERGKIEQEIERILELERSEMESSMYEQYRDKFYQVELLAEETGFVQGFKYAVNLMAECYMGEAVTVESE